MHQRMTESNGTHLPPHGISLPWISRGLCRIWLGWIYQSSGMIAESLGRKMKKVVFGVYCSSGIGYQIQTIPTILRTVFSSKLQRVWRFLQRKQTVGKTICFAVDIFGTVRRNPAEFRWLMPGLMWKRPGVPFAYDLHSLWTFWRRHPRPWTVGRLDVLGCAKLQPWQ